MAGEKWKMGKITVTRITKIEMIGGLSRFLPDATQEAVCETSWPRLHLPIRLGACVASAMR